MRMWYVRDEYAKGNTALDWMQGGSIPTDKLTKLGTAEEHHVFCRNILGHNLLDEEQCIINNNCFFSLQDDSFYSYIYR